MVAAMMTGLSGCGFHLKGRDTTGGEATVDAGGPLNSPIYLIPSNEFAATRRAIQQVFQDADVPLVDFHEATAIYIKRETIRRIPIATTALIDAAEYELRIEIDLVVSPAGDNDSGDGDSGDGDQAALVRTVTVSAERNYSVDTRNLSGSQEEEQLLLEDMREDLAHQAMRRIAALLRSAVRSP